MSAKIKTFLKQIESGKIDSMKMKLYDVIKQSNSISTKTLRERFGAHQSVTSALSLLESDGLIRKSGEIEFNGINFSQWVALTDINLILSMKKEVEQKKKKQWIKRAQRMGWIDDQVAYFLTNHIFNKINFHDENAN